MFSFGCRSLGRSGDRTESRGLRNGSLAITTWETFVGGKLLKFLDELQDASECRFSACWRLACACTWQFPMQNIATVSLCRSPYSAGSFVILCKSFTCGLSKLVARNVILASCLIALPMCKGTTTAKGPQPNATETQFDQPSACHIQMGRLLRLRCVWWAWRI
jgi:hypothetical protein